jgi:hypothetical protein
MFILLIMPFGAFGGSSREEFRRKRPRDANRTGEGAGERTGLSGRVRPLGGIGMKKVISLTVVLATTLALGGCYSPQDRAVGGAALGGATGALIGGAASNSVGGAVAGGLIGAAAGGIIGANTAPARRPRCAEFDVDYYGRRHCIAWYN